MAGQIKAVSLERIEQRIVVIRSKKVMLSTHLAELYEVEPRALVQAVKRNLDRFPADFMFQLSKAEFANLKSQFVISNGADYAGLYGMRSRNRALQCCRAC